MLFEGASVQQLARDLLNGGCVCHNNIPGGWSYLMWHINRHFVQQQRGGGPSVVAAGVAERFPLEPVELKAGF